MSDEAKAEIDKVEADPKALEPEFIDQILQRQLMQAKINGEEARRESLRTGARERRRRVDAAIKSEKALTEARIANDDKLADTQTEDLKKRTSGEQRDRRLRTEAKIEDRRAWTQADIAGQAQRAEAEVERFEAETRGIEGRDKALRDERYFWMRVTAAGLIFFAVLTLLTLPLALFTADHVLLKYPVSPLLGLGVSAGGGYRLHVLDRSRRKRAMGERTTL